MVDFRDLLFTRVTSNQQVKLTSYYSIIIIRREFSYYFVTNKQSHSEAISTRFMTGNDPFGLMGKSGAAVLSIDPTTTTATDKKE